MPTSPWSEAFRPMLLRGLPADWHALIELGPRHPKLGTPCVLWLGKRMSRNGYGRRWCKQQKRERQAHIQVWEQCHGPVPKGMLLDHLCSTRNCVAPWHCEPLTPRINTLRGAAVLFQKQRGMTCH